MAQRPARWREEDLRHPRRIERGDTTGPVEERYLDYVILGVGMNANLDPAELGVPDREVTTIRSELGRVDVLELLRALLSNLD